MKTSHLFAVTAASVLGLLVGRAAADPVGNQRDGATFGVGIGGGHMGCTVDGEPCSDDSTRPAGGLSLRAGWMLTPRLALTGNLWGMAHQDDRLTVRQGIFAGKVRSWVLDRLWLEGGLGVARASTEIDLGIGQSMTESETVPAIVGGIGLEIVRTPSMGVDLQLDAGTGFYDDEVRVHQVALGAAVNFY
jgi:hypothetical protein